MCQLEQQQQWEEGTRLCMVYSPLTLAGHPENISLFLSGSCRLSCSGPVIWYYSQLNVGFTEAAWIKRVPARMYLVLCKAVNRFAEWGFNVFLYTNIMGTSWNIICEAECWRFLKCQVGHFGVSEHLPPLVVHRHCITNLKYIDRTWRYMELVSKTVAAH